MKFRDRRRAAQSAALENRDSLSLLVIGAARFQRAAVWGSMSFHALLLIIMAAGCAGCSSVGPAGPQPPPPASLDSPLQGPGHLDHPEELNNLDNINLDQAKP